MFTLTVALWCMFMGVESTVQAEELLLTSGIPPEELLAQFEQTSTDEKLIKETLKRYAKGSKYVVRGEVTQITRLTSGSARDREAYVEVLGWMRGEGPERIKIMMPYNAPYVPTDWSTVPGTLIKGYEVIIFLDDQYRVVEGNALFYADGDLLWRNKRADFFLAPANDREWQQVGENPYDDYVVIDVADVRKMLDKQQPAKWLR